MSLKQKIKATVALIALKKGNNYFVHRESIKIVSQKKGTMIPAEFN